VLDIWFVAGIALGAIVTGFCAIGSFDRGSDSVRRKSWSDEHAARRRAVPVSHRGSRHAPADDHRGSLPKAQLTRGPTRIWAVPASL
jgi:hypothetical protein